jgi:hypothetical protein
MESPVSERMDVLRVAAFLPEYLAIGRGLERPPDSQKPVAQWTSVDV